MASKITERDLFPGCHKPVEKGFDSKKDKVNFVFMLPNVAIYLKYFFDYISGKQVQIYWTVSDQAKVTMIVTCYFPPQNIVAYIEEQLPKEMIAMHGTMRFTDRKKKVKRAYKKRKSKVVTETQTNEK